MAHRGCGFTPLPLPCYGEPLLISEISSRSFESKTTDLSGKTVRVVGRVRAYDPISQVLLLVEPSLSSKSTTTSTSLGSSSKPSSRVPDNVLVVDTRLTDGLDCCCGSQVMFIGELENWPESRLADISDQVAMNLHVPSGQNDSNSWKGDIVMKAVISKCVDRLDYSLYLQCIPVWRRGDEG